MGHEVKQLILLNVWKLSPLAFALHYNLLEDSNGSIDLGLLVIKVIFMFSSLII